LLFEHFKEAKDVSFYADKLCVSPKYLSSLVKQMVGKPAKDCIDYCIIMESKVLLNSSYTIQEISQQLNFPNQSFFGKYFKKHTGISPLNYRRSTLN
jgi:AraC-like DNA-binding protein